LPKLTVQKDTLEALHAAQAKQEKEIARLSTDLGAFHTEMVQGLKDTQISIGSAELEIRHFKRDVESLQRHVRGLDTTVREGFAKMTELLTKEPAS
jgi:uncharacterized coiled-coil protein SlyX